MMSLDLLQGYSSEEVGVDGDLSPLVSEDDDDEEVDDVDAQDEGKALAKGKTLVSSLASKPRDSPLPSVLDTFAMVTGPPEFLNNCFAPPEEPGEALGVLNQRHRVKRDRKDLPPGAVVESKPQLVGIRDRVRSDEGNLPASVSGLDGKRVMGAANPSREDAAELLRMCIQCGIPKTYSHARGMVCPVCGDRPPTEGVKDAEKKKGSTIKDKEKSKRMRGQSSHASWKSETEMVLRQQYD